MPPLDPGVRDGCGVEHVLRDFKDADPSLLSSSSTISSLSLSHSLSL
jgi:hypothetical protein